MDDLNKPMGWSNRGVSSRRIVPVIEGRRPRGRKFKLALLFERVVWATLGAAAALAGTYLAQNIGTFVAGWLR